jgi:hypothetical protein
MRRRVFKSLNARLSTDASFRDNEENAFKVKGILFSKTISCPEEREPRAPLCLLLVSSFVSSFHSSLGAGNGEIFF